MKNIRIHFKKFHFIPIVSFKCYTGAFKSDICVQKVCIQGKTVRKMKNVNSLLLIERNSSLVLQHSQEMGGKPVNTCMSQCKWQKIMSF